MKDLCGAPLGMTILRGFDEKHPTQVSAYGAKPLDRKSAGTSKKSGKTPVPHTALLLSFRNNTAIECGELALVPVGIGRRCLAGGIQLGYLLSGQVPISCGQVLA
jgi:hypothetical protein